LGRLLGIINRHVSLGRRSDGLVELDAMFHKRIADKRPVGGQPSLEYRFA
jgi:hypothetical protein